MKTFLASVIVALSVSAATVSFASTEKGSTENSKANTTFQVGMYPSAETAKLNVLVEKVKGTTVTVQLLNEKGQVLAAQRLGKNDLNYHLRFDLSGLSDGKYQVIVADGVAKTVKEVNLETTTPVKADRVISMR